MFNCLKPRPTYFGFSMKKKNPAKLFHRLPLIKVLKWCQNQSRENLGLGEVMFIFK